MAKKTKEQAVQPSSGHHERAGSASIKRTMMKWTPSSASASTEASPAEAGRDEVDIGFGKERQEKKRLQSNLAGQVKNAKNKLAQGAMGIVTLTDGQRKDLLQKVKFGEDYAEVKDQCKKDQMLVVFKADKSCKTWATYQHVYEKSESTTERRVNGYGTKLLGNIV